MCVCMCMCLNVVGTMCMQEPIEAREGNRSFRANYNAMPLTESLEYDG